jgi:DNA-binding NarL/FixJ family response regulator
MTRMLVVEDHPLLAASTQELFLNMGLADEVMVCHTVSSAREQLQVTNDWFRIWLDIEMHGTHGLSLIREVHSLGFAPCAAVITANRNPQWQSEVKSMGFLGYVPKAVGVETFKYAVQQISQGRPYFEDAKDGKLPSRLTRRQIDILKLVAQGLASKEIARQLNISAGTVDNIIAAIISTLCAKGRTHAVSIGVEYGYIPPEVFTHASESLMT